MQSYQLTPQARRWLVKFAEELAPLSDQVVSRYAHDLPGFVQDMIAFPPGERVADYQLRVMHTLMREHRVAVRGPHGLGKCLHPDDDILLHDGTWRAAGKLVGQTVEVMSFKDMSEPRPAQATLFDNGVREVIEIETEKGRVIRRTKNHPLWGDLTPRRWDDKVYANRLRPQGAWVQAGDVVAGSVVAVRCGEANHKSEPAPDAHVVIAAALLGDGGLTGGGVRFTQADASSSLFVEFEKACNELGCKLKRDGDTITYRVIAGDDATKNPNGTNVNPVHNLCRTWGIFGKGSRDKQFPDFVWKLPPEQLARFLSVLYACDGWASATKSKNRWRRQIGYATVSKRLATDVSRALLRLGIQANTLQKTTHWQHGGEKKSGRVYEVTINDVDNLVRFSDMVGIVGKAGAVQGVLDTCRGASAGKTHKWRVYGLPHGYRWEKVKRVVPLGAIRTVGITVPETHHFLTEFVEHNTALAAWVVLWALETSEDVKIITTASAWRQLTKYLWPEVHKWAGRLRFDKLGHAAYNQRQLMRESLRLGPGREASAVSPADPQTMEGAHARRIVYIFDESKLISPKIFESAEGAFSQAWGDTGREAYALAISTPGVPAGPFYEMHAGQPAWRLWTPVHVSRDEVIAAGLMSKTWAEEMRQAWGENDYRYQNRILGEFAASESASIVPLAWVHLANERWYAWQEAGRPGMSEAEIVRIGADIATADGSDRTALALRFDNVIASLDTFKGISTMEAVGKIGGLLRKYSAQSPQAIVDALGPGAGVFERLDEQGYSVYSYKGSESTAMTSREGGWGFTNVRSASYFGLRERLNPDSGDDVALPPDGYLTADLTAPTWGETSGGKIKVEAKDRIIARLGRSPDSGDAVAMAFWPGEPRGVVFW